MGRLQAIFVQFVNSSGKKEVEEPALENVDGIINFVCYFLNSNLPFSEESQRINMILKNIYLLLLNFSFPFSHYAPTIFLLALALCNS